MRTWGKIDGVWTEVSSDPVNGDSLVWLTTLCQTLKLGLGESPFFANYGIPAQQSVLSQIFPDYYVAVTQSQFAQYFASLVIAKLDDPQPHYRVSVVLPVGARVSQTVPI